MRLDILKSVWADHWNIVLALTMIAVAAGHQAGQIFVIGQGPGVFLWFCDIMSYILAFALLFKNRLIISTVLISALPAQFLWILDVVLTIFGISIGRSSNVFNSPVWWTPALSILMHAILIPFAGYGVWKLGFSKKSIYGVYVLAFTLLPISYFFASGDNNYNCVLYPCDMDYITDKALILAHPDYMSLKYLFMQIRDDILYGTAVYGAFIVLIHLRKKYFS